MEKCIIITSYVEGQIKDLVDISVEDYVICADGGYDLAAKEGITPNIVLGDFDSSRLPLSEGVEVITVPAKKDETDTALCIDHAAEKGFRHILIIGGIGGRLDHTIANIQNIFAYAQHGVSIIMVNEGNVVTALVNSSTLIPTRPGYKLSIFSHSQVSRGVTVRNVEYPLTNHTLTSDYPLGISNEFIGEDAFIEVKDGQLLIVMSHE